MSIIVPIIHKHGVVVEDFPLPLSVQNYFRKTQMPQLKSDERRGNYPRSEKDLYKIKNIEGEMASERRVDELDRMREVREQKKTWYYTVGFCALLNLVLIGLALSGMEW